MILISGPRPLLAIVSMCLLVGIYASGQKRDREEKLRAVEVGECSESAPQTFTFHTFRRLGETIEIPISMADCQPVALELHWANGRNNGSNFSVTFLDSDDRPVHSKQFTGFMTGSLEFPFPAFYSQLDGGARTIVSVPATISIQTVSPFAYPASLSYRVMRVPLHPRQQSEVKNTGAPSQKEAFRERSGCNEP
ncbi:MAG: hypothetical protein M3R52_12155 [Acidobacteriota bacterium]|nr:hypothetical protein [Acidobacteriota bacterium]